jgi:hypothetical protein
MAQGRLAGFSIETEIIKGRAERMTQTVETEARLNEALGVQRLHHLPEICLKAVACIRIASFVHQDVLAFAGRVAQLVAKWCWSIDTHDLPGLALSKVKYSPSQQDQVTETMSPTRMPT